MHNLERGQWEGGKKVRNIWSLFKWIQPLFFNLISEIIKSVFLSKLATFWHFVLTPFCLIIHEIDIRYWGALEHVIYTEIEVEILAYIEFICKYSQKNWLQNYMSLYYRTTESRTTETIWAIIAGCAFSAVMWFINLTNL